MVILVIHGICHDRKIEPWEKIPYKTDKNVIILFLDDVEDKIWEDVVAKDFMKGYFEKDAVYDNI